MPETIEKSGFKAVFMRSRKGQGRRKSVNKKRKRAYLPSTVTLNTHGMNTSNHNAFWKKKVPVRSV
jgi:hypothetical protein